jgi:hypothetical protein
LLVKINSLTGTTSMNAFKKGIAIVLAGTFVALIVSSFAWPQGAVTLVQILLGNTTVSSSNPLPVSGTFSASLAGFPTVQTTGTPIAVTTAGVTGTLPAGLVVVASNVGSTNGAFCKLGASATLSDQLIPPDSWFAFTVGANTELTCITAASTTTINLVGGSGLPTGSGGGGGGGGSGGNVTIVDPLGQQVAANSIPVVLPATQITALTPPATFPLNATPSLANGNGVVPTQGGAVLSATNGAFANILQGNAVLSSSNPLFAQLTAGTASIGNIGTLSTISNPVTVVQPTASNLNITCANCSGSGASGTDEATFTAGASVFAPGGGFFQTTATNNPLTTGQWGTFQVTANRALFVNLRSSTGVELGGIAAPLFAAGAGTAGTPNAGVMTVQGVASMTPLASNLTQVNGATFSASNPLFAQLTAGSAAIGSITNTTFAATQATAANLNATVVGPSGAALATSTNQNSQIAQETAINTNLGTPNTTPCASPTTACTINQMLALIAQTAAAPATIANQPVGATNFAPAQVSVGTSATSIAAARAGAIGTGRVSITITNTTTTPIFLGGSGVTATTGQLLPGIVGASVTLNTTAAIFGIAASAATVTEFETF